MTSNAARLRQLQADLEYHEMMTRVDLRAYMAGLRKCAELRVQITRLSSPPAREERPKAEAWSGQAEQASLFEG